MGNPPDSDHAKWDRRGAAPRSHSLAASKCLEPRQDHIRTCSIRYYEFVLIRQRESIPGPPARRPGLPGPHSASRSNQHVPQRVGTPMKIELRKPLTSSPIRATQGFALFEDA